MKTINLTVNGKAIRGIGVEPRTQLADFLRDTLDLTGTHLGCEHGVCGACTLMIDGVPARSCITLAVACDGAAITTIEGMDEDEVMAALRTAFSRDHALQCGFCTPGMLASAHDIVLRTPDATEAEVRYAMSGNLCRCTGYVGITKAVLRVLQERRDAGKSAPVNLRTTLGPVGSGHAPAMGADTVGSVAVVRHGASQARLENAAGAPRLQSDDLRGAVQSPAGAGTVERSDAGTGIDTGTGTSRGAGGGRAAMTVLNQTFSVDFPREQVWDFFGQLGEVTLCLPGASLLAPATDTHVEPKLRIKVGPIVANFEGAADVQRDPASYTGTIHGSARDTKSSSATRGEIRYVLTEENGGHATRVDVEVGFALTGALAQFSRSSIVRDIAQRMTDAFAQNLRARLGHAGGGGIDSAPLQPAAELNAGALLFTVLRERIAGFLRRLFGRG